MIRYISFLAAFILITFASYSDYVHAETQADLVERELSRATFRKSGTPEILQLFDVQAEGNASFAAVYRTLSRPTADIAANSEHFRVHYDSLGMDAPDLTDYDSNGVPDYVDSTLVYLEYAYELLTGELGYGIPVSDGSEGGGEGLIDCYLRELAGQQVYGYSIPDSGIMPTPAYIVIDNDFSESVYPTKSFGALKITTAHEFFHVIHYDYFGGTEAIWWMEQTAVWFEDCAWDDVNDYLNYIHLLFDSRDYPIDTVSGNFMYGATLFAFLISHNYGDNYIRQAWDKFRSSRSGKIENFNAVFPQGVSGALSELAVWMYFTNYRAATGNFFPDAALMQNTVEPDKTHKAVNLTDSLTFKQYTFKYVELDPDNGFAEGDSLFFHFEDPNNGTWRTQLILYHTANDFDVLPLAGLDAAVEVPGTYDRAILAITNASQIKANYQYIYTTTIKECVGVEEKSRPEPFALQPNFPNPFNASTTIPFAIDHAGPIMLTVVNLQGQRVATLEDGWFEPGEYMTTYNASGLSSGIYFAVLESADICLTRRMMYVK